MCKIDLKDAFFLVNVDKESRKYLRFQVEGLTFEFTCLPFGLSISPYIFTKIMKSVMHCLRSRGFMSVIYLDDILCIGKDYDECMKNVKETVGLLESLGFVVNYGKSELEPSKSCEYLGFVIDSHELTLELPVKKKQKISEMIDKVLVKSKCRIREFAKFIGNLITACPSVPYGPLYCKNFERAKMLALLINDGNYDQDLRIEKYISNDILVEE